MLTIAKLSRWSINYYNDTARAAGQAARDARCANGGLGEYYSEHDTRTSVWLCAGDAHTAAALVGLSDGQRAGGEADPEVVARWLDDGVAPNGAAGRGFGRRAVHGFDLTFCAPKSVSLIRALRGDDVADKAVLGAHTTAISEALEYLAQHAGYTRVHNPHTGNKDLVRLPGLVAIAYQHETSRAGDPHLHTHVLVPNRQARGDGKLVSLDGTSLFHEAKAAGVIYQATLRRELHRALGLEWAPVDPATGMAEVAGIAAASISAWSQRSSALREWAANNLVVVDGAKATQAQLAAAQKATRPAKPEQLAWAQLAAMWRADARGLRLDRQAFQAARKARRAAAAAAKAPLNRRRLLAVGEAMDKAAFTRADLVELIGAQLPVDTERGPRALVEAAVDALGLRLTGPRAAHQREGHERFTLEAFLAEEQAVLDLVDASDPRAQLWVREHDTNGLSADQARAVTTIATTEQLVCPLSAPAGAGKTTSMRALAAMARRRFQARVIVVAPTGKAVDVAVREGAGDTGYTVAKALKSLQDGSLTLGHLDLVIVDEAAMIGTDELRRLLAATTAAHTKTVLVGDAHQLAPVKARGGMFAQLCADLPWTQKLCEVWRMRDPDERSASLAIRDGGPAPVRRAVDWYRARDRLHTGDPIAMAADALQAYQADAAAGKDALLICDTKEIADALNRRIHDDTIPRQAPTVSAGRGHRIAKGDVIISRRNEPAIAVYDAADITTPAADPVRNGQRWHVLAVDPQNDRIAARRLDDGARTVFSGDYLHQHITYGYAVTVHSAQGVTADTTHAVLGEHTSRNLLYVALTRGRDTNHAYLYERQAGETEHEHPDQQPGVHVARRGTSAQAAQLVRAIIGTRDNQARTAHDIAAQTEDREQLPERVQHLLAGRTHAVHARRTAYARRHDDILDERIERQRFIDEHLSRSQDREQGIDYGLEL
ncbi:relaxase domain-containing protein (plasmid) [Mycobacterium intracellulare subsp. chimaera]|uniref:MobF family relaxase n=7 Tax=Bacteria TaxID=2 RepID=UPI0006CA9BB8|nr:MobF family relaxase [Mycobacterium intracellulare]ARV85414.1 AAA family ATPase [Mycobacterium intracellulare subsp. chimaera]ASL24271.1 ATP-dependent exoDNAse [Mycobacterium intracellulare subsp. chimaera]KPN46631.1 AAA family ATPase [Mycobacterium intracellulare subsp. chimaera]QGK52092.1 relaxase domain-containing protein [Mycobacterium intracellulare subsp. chimaera]UCN07143.1 relaxase domain-containing protein [Mycobacterium intracellulare subsp. chimaera]